MRYDWLTQYLFGSISEVQEHATRWARTYNIQPPILPWAASPQNNGWKSPFHLYFSDHRKEGHYRSSGVVHSVSAQCSDSHLPVFMVRPQKRWLVLIVDHDVFRNGNEA